VTTCWRLRGTAALLVLLAGAAPAGPAAAAPTDPDPVVVTVRDGEVRMPSSLRPGQHRFVLRARGSQDGVQLIRPRRGYSAAEYRRDAARVESGAAPVARRAERRINANVRLRGGALADEGRRAVFWQTLSAGRLWAVSESRPQDVHQVRVSGRLLRAPAPAASTTIIVADRSVRTPATMPAAGVFELRNAGTVPHMVGLAKLVPGRTAADAVAYLQAVLDPGSTLGAAELTSPFDDSVFGAPTMSVHPRERMLLRYALPAGDYIAVCVTPDLASGQLHIQQDEIVGVTLT
jgi:hypothetical protein